MPLASEPTESSPPAHGIAIQDPPPAPAANARRMRCLRHSLPGTRGAGATGLDCAPGTQRGGQTSLSHSPLHALRPSPPRAAALRAAAAAAAAAASPGGW